jgi:hypothetical protein
MERPGTLICDLFDLDGVYIAKVRIPRYYNRDHDIMTNSETAFQERLLFDYL